jgi:hypothetical protein
MIFNLDYKPKVSIFTVFINFRSICFVVWGIDQHLIQYMQYSDVVDLNQWI